MTGKMLIKNIGELVTCAGGPKAGKLMNDIGIVENAALIVADGVIEKICAGSEAEKEFEFVLDAGGRCVMPGIVDSHTHFVFDGYREDEFEWRLNGESYMQIMQRGGGIAKSVRATRNASWQTLMENGCERLAAMLKNGVTTVEGKSGYGLDTETEKLQLQVMQELNAVQPLEIVSTFMAAHAVPPEYPAQPDGYLEYVIRDVLPVCASYAEFCDVFCERGVFSVEQSRKLLTCARERGLLPKLHADEIVSTGGAELAAELGAVSADHLLNATDAGIAMMAQRGTACVLLPATAFALREQYARARCMIESGAIVALATDFNPGSCCTASIPLVIALAALQMRMTNAEIITALTINGAYAVNRHKRVGSIEPGKQADLVMLKYPSHKFLTYRVAENCVHTVIKKGRIAYSLTAC